MRIDKRPQGKILIPASKSVSHRALICAAISGGGAVSNIVENADTRMTLDCLARLGAGFEKENGCVSFYRPPGVPGENEVFDCGESGATLRFLIPVVSVFGVPVRFTGRGRLLERPLTPYVTALGPRGVAVRLEDGFVHVTGKLTPGLFELPGDVSSQFVSGLLLALPMLEGGSEIVMTSPLESRSYVDLTLDTLEKCGVAVENLDYTRFVVAGGQRYKKRDCTVEADYSGAAFFLAAGALGCDVTCAGLNPDSKQGDKKFLELIAGCGGRIYWTAPDTVRVAPGELKAITVDVSDIPDIVPPLAVLLCFCRGRSRIANAARLRLKESDRLRSVAAELNKLGARITEGGDFLEIEGVERLQGGHCHGHNDHRIAMMAALASLRAEEPVYIDQPDCVSKSYPGFWADFLKV